MKLFYFLITTLLVGLSVANMQAQTIEKLSNRIALMEKSSDTVLQKQGARLKSLINDVQPALYLQNGHVLPYTNTVKPVVLTTDAASFSKLYESNLLYEKVELICIKIEKPQDLVQLLNLSQIKDFKSLKYIYVLFTCDVCAGVNADNCVLFKAAGILNGIENCNYKIVYEININE